MRIQSGSALESGINVTPFVDICLVLLVIFMIIVPTMVTGIPVQLPIAKGEPIPEALQQSIITVKEDRTVYLDTAVLRRDEFAPAIRRLHEKFPQKPIAVRGDRSVSYGDVVDVLDECRSAGYADVRLLSQRPHGTG